MNQVKKTVIVPYSAQQMFKLVDDIDNYSKYLPWCPSSKREQLGNGLVKGSVSISYLGVNTAFVTYNNNTLYSKISMQLVNGPFKEFFGTWDFTELGDSGCKVDFTLNYKFSSVIIEKVIGPVFSYIAKNIVESFIKEAHHQYGCKPNL